MVLGSESRVRIPILHSPPHRIIVECVVQSEIKGDSSAKSFPRGHVTKPHLTSSVLHLGRQLGTEGSRSLPSSPLIPSQNL